MKTMLSFNKQTPKSTNMSNRKPFIASALYKIPLVYVAALAFICASIIPIYKFDINTAIAQTVIDTIDVGLSPQGVAANFVTNRIYVTNSVDDNVSVIDGALNQVVDTVVVGNKPREIGVNTATNRIFVSNFEDNTVSVIDGTTNQVIDTIAVGKGPQGIGVNVTANRIYVANSSSDDISVIDGLTNRVIETIAVDVAPTTIEVNTATNRIYSVFIASGRTGVIVIDGITNQIIDTISSDINNPRDVGANPDTNTIYLSNDDGTISVLDGVTHDITNVITVRNAPLQRIAINAPGNRIYVIDPFNSIASVIDSVENRVVGQIQVVGPSGIETNIATNLVYIASTSSSTGAIVTVVKDDGAPTPVTPPTPEPTPIPTAETPEPETSPTPPPTGKSFTFKCNNRFVRGRAGLEKLTLVLGENEECVLKLDDLEPGSQIEIATYLKTRFRTAIKVDPINGVTNANGELEFTITALKKGSDWIAWAVPNDKGEFKFTKKAYDTGLAWGMFVEVR